MAGFLHFQKLTSICYGGFSSATGPGYPQRPHGRPDNCPGQTSASCSDNVRGVFNCRVYFVDERLKISLKKREAVLN